jgi:hypothetical protein
MRRRSLSIAPGLALATALASMSLSCKDPILDRTVANQGKETSGIDKGEFHRAGQHCVVCHQAHGDSSDHPFTLAGTIFAQPARQVGVSGVEIRLTDSDGTKYTAKTNCVGNFFIKPTEWAPKFPILVEIAKNNIRRQMHSPIGREPDCAACHQLEIPPPDPFAQMPHIYLFGGDEPGAPDGDPSCPVDPVRPGSPSPPTTP